MLGVVPPGALHMTANEEPFARADVVAILLVECALTPVYPGPYKPREWHPQPSGPFIAWRQPSPYEDSQGLTRQQLSHCSPQIAFRTKTGIS